MIEVTLVLIPEGRRTNFPNVLFFSVAGSEGEMDRHAMRRTEQAKHKLMWNWARVSRKSEATSGSG